MPPAYRIAEAAQLLGVSDDTVRRWVDSGRLPASRDGGGPAQVDGAELARLATSLHEAPEPGATRGPRPATGCAASSPGSSGTR